ncbi:MAG: hypothetical protein WCI74_11520 [Actinomycetes bacterium]
MANGNFSFDRDNTPTQTAWNITGHLVAGMAFYGGLGWLLGLWFGNTSLFVAVGLIVGIAAGTYLTHVHLRNEEASVEQSERVKAWMARLK